MCLWSYNENEAAEFMWWYGKELPSWRGNQQPQNEVPGTGRCRAPRIKDVVELQEGKGSGSWGSNMDSCVGIVFSQRDNSRDGEAVITVDEVVGNVGNLR